MYRFLLRPKWLAFHLLVVGAVILMANLGLWQLHRLEDRRSFNDDVRVRSSQPAVAYADLVVPGTNPGELAWRTVEVTGTYLASEEVVVINRSQAGVVGRNVVTPLVLNDDTLVLVNRGFVPELDAVPAPPTGIVAIIGRVRTTEVRRLGGLTESAEGALAEFQRLDIERIARQLPAPVAGVSIELADSSPPQGALPVPVPAPQLTEGPHLSYMVQWWIFALAAIAGWILAVRRSARKGVSRSSAPSPQGSPSPTATEAATTPS